VDHERVAKGVETLRKYNEARCAISVKASNFAKVIVATRNHLSVNVRTDNSPWWKK